MPQACRALQDQEASQVLRETVVSLVSVESLESRGQQVSDGRSWGRASVSLCPPKLLTLPLHHYCTHQVRAGIGGLGVAALYVGRRQSDERGYCAHREDWLLGVMEW